MAATLDQRTGSMTASAGMAGASENDAARTAAGTTVDVPMAAGGTGAGAGMEGATVSGADGTPTDYVVKEGDNLTKIAKQLGTTPEALYAANEGVIGGDKNLIKPGQTLAVPGAGAMNTSASSASSLGTIVERPPAVSGDQLKKELAGFLGVNASTRPDGAISTDLTVGAKGPEVGALQRSLKLLGYEVGKIDNTFGSTTDGAYKEYLKDVKNGVWNISDTGIHTPNLKDIPASLVQVVYGEAAGQNYASKVGVASVINNRLADTQNEFRNLTTYDAVIFQKNAFQAVDGTLYNNAANPDRLTGVSLEKYNQTARAVINVSRGFIGDPTGGALYYYSPYISEPSYISRGVNAGTLQQVTPADVSSNDFQFYRRK